MHLVCTCVMEYGLISHSQGVREVKITGNSKINDDYKSFLRTIFTIIRTVSKWRHKTFDFDRREQQLSTAVERNDYLNDELSSERHSNSLLRKKVESANHKIEEMTNQNNYLENLVLRYEQVSIIKRSSFLES